MKGVPGSRLVSPRIDYQRLGIRLSRHRRGFGCRNANSSGVVRTKEYDLFIDRVGAGLGWSKFLAGSERVCESVNATGLSRRQCWIISCASSPTLPDDDQCFGRPVIGGPCCRGKLGLSTAACAALKLLAPQRLNFQARECFRRG